MEWKEKNDSDDDDDDDDDDDVNEKKWRGVEEADGWQENEIYFGSNDKKPLPVVLPACTRLPGRLPGTLVPVCKKRLVYYHQVSNNKIIIVHKYQVLQVHTSYPGPWEGPLIEIFSLILIRTTLN